MPDHDEFTQTLQELVVLGMTVARRVAAAEDLPPEQAARAFNLAARAVRRTVLLARAHQRPAPRATGPERAAARRQVLRTVEDSLSTRAPAEARDELTRELHERLDAPETEHDILSRPAKEVIAEICRDLGLSGAMWKRRTPDDLRALNRRAAAPLPPAEGRNPLPLAGRGRVRVEPPAPTAPHRTHPPPA